MQVIIVYLEHYTDLIAYLAYNLYYNYTEVIYQSFTKFSEYIKVRRRIQDTRKKVASNIF